MEPRPEGFPPTDPITEAKEKFSQFHQKLSDYCAENAQPVGLGDKVFYEEAPDHRIGYITTRMNPHMKLEVNAVPYKGISFDMEGFLRYVNIGQGGVFLEIGYYPVGKFEGDNDNLQSFRMMEGFRNGSSEVYCLDKIFKSQGGSHIKGEGLGYSFHKPSDHPNPDPQKGYTEVERNEVSDVELEMIVSCLTQLDGTVTQLKERKKESQQT